MVRYKLFCQYIRQKDDGIRQDKFQIFPYIMLEENVETAIRKRIEDGVGNLYVLVNYTALFSTHNILKKMEGEKEQRGVHKVWGTSNGSRMLFEKRKITGIPQKDQ